MSSYIPPSPGHKSAAIAFAKAIGYRYIIITQAPLFSDCFFTSDQAIAQERYLDNTGLGRYPTFIDLSAPG